MWSRIFNRVAAVSFVVCLLTFGWWLRSRGTMDEVLFKPAVTSDVMDSTQLWGCDGKWMYIHTVLRPAPQAANHAGWVVSWMSVPCDISARPKGTPGIDWPSFTRYEGPLKIGNATGTEHVIVFPVWPLAMASSVAPALWILLHSTRRTTPQGMAVVPPTPRSFPGLPDDLPQPGMMPSA